MQLFMTLKFVELVSHLTILRLRQVLIADFSKGGFLQ